MSSLATLTQWLTGEFDNQKQALDQPIWFVHLRLWHLPFPIAIDGYPALFAEQANALFLTNPYRQRVFVLKPTQESDRSEAQFEAQYFGFRQPDRVCGAGQNPDLLKSITLDDLEPLPGCCLKIQFQDDRFTAQAEPGAKCCFQYNGETRQVVLGFEATADRYISHDRGVDPNTGQALWGAVMGAYEFQKL
ncbi:chromophore lyase CpcT/CpeT [Leptolyngbya ohadii]|uniref:chromophore lyase CpcT/CpeT n=1 Tax=Leptolyngbya ohadii TaxID=1962290 RepID=UPI000B5A1207|nr:chromophore lyase CpcT/CpeT [Leptolyngbya ohadii]